MSKNSHPLRRELYDLAVTFCFFVTLLALKDKISQKQKILIFTFHCLSLAFHRRKVRLNLTSCLTCCYNLIDTSVWLIYFASPNLDSLLTLISSLKDLFKDDTFDKLYNLKRITYPNENLHLMH